MSADNTELYILDADGRPHPAVNLFDWQTWMRENPALRRVAGDILTGDFPGAAIVLTTFAGYDPGSNSPPLLWSTSIGGGHAHGYVRRSLSREHALVAHCAAVLLASTPPGTA